MKGRPAKHPKQHQLDGTTGPLQIELFAPHGVPHVPLHLSDDAVACAEEIVRGLTNAKLIGELDTFALSLFASAWAWHKAACEEMNKPEFEAIVKTQTGLSPNPWFRILNNQAQLMVSLLPKLYLSPADRLYKPGKPAKEADPRSKFADLIGRNASLGSLSVSRSRPV